MGKWLSDAWFVNAKRGVLLDPRRNIKVDDDDGVEKLYSTQLLASIILIN